MKNYYLLFLLLLNSCGTILVISEPFVSNPSGELFQLLDKIHSEPDSIFVYIQNSKFYDETYTKHIEPNNEFYLKVIKNIKECQRESYTRRTRGPILTDGGRFGTVKKYEVMYVYNNFKKGGLRLTVIRRDFNWKLVSVSHVIHDYILRYVNE